MRVPSACGTNRFHSRHVYKREAGEAASSARIGITAAALRRYRPARQGGVLVNRFLTLTRPLGLVVFVAVVAGFGSLMGASSAFGTSKPPSGASRASFQGLGQMPGSSCGTQALGISGDGSVIAGAGCVSSGKTEAFRWTAAGGYQRLGDLGGGSSDARAASFDGSVVVGQSVDASGTPRAYRWTAAQGMVALPLLPSGNEAEAVTDDGTMAAGGNAWWKTSGQTGNFGNCGDAQISLAMADLSADGSVAAGSGLMAHRSWVTSSTPTGPP